MGKSNTGAPYAPVYDVLNTVASNAKVVEFVLVRLGLSPHEGTVQERKKARRAIREEIQKRVARSKLNAYRKRTGFDNWASDRKSKYAHFMHFNDIEQQSGVGSTLMSMLGVDTEAANLAMKKLADIDVDAINTASESLKESADQAQSTFACIGGIVETVKSYVTSLFESFKKNMGAIALKCAVAAFAIWIIMSKMTQLVIHTVMSVVRYFFPDGIWARVCDLIWQKAETGGIQQQSGMEDIGFFSRIASLFAVGTAVKESVDSKGVGVHLVNLVNSKMTSHTRTVSGYEDVFKFIIDLVEKGVNIIRGFFGMPPTRLMTRHSTEIDAALLRCSEIERAEATGGCEKTPVMRLAAINAQHHMLRKMQETYRWNHEINGELERAIRVLSALAKPLRAACGEGTGYKPLPLSLVMYGNPGVGKTLMSQALTNALLVCSGDVTPGMSAEEAGRLIFSKPFNSEYLDGYCGQPVYLMDDYMLKKASLNDSGNGFLDLMTFYSSFTTLCNMATCENKGMFPFTSRIILMTTNMKVPSEAGVDQILICPPALNRRVDLNYEVVVRPEFRLDNTQKLDYQKFLSELARCDREGHVLQQFPWHIWEVHPQNWDAGYVDPVPGNGRPFLELMYKAIKLMKERSISHTATVDMCARMLKARPPTDEELADMYSGADCGSNVVQQSGVNVKEIVGLINGSNLSSWNPYQAERPNPYTIEAMSISDPEITPAEWQAINNGYRFETEAELEARVSSTESSIDYPFDQNAAMGFWARTRMRLSKAFSGYAAIVVNFFERIKPYACIIGGLVAVRIIADTIVRFVVDLVKAAVRFIRTSLGYPDEQSNAPKSTKVKFASLQSGSPNALYELVYNNGFKMLAQTTGDEFVVLGQVTFLRRDYACFPKHFMTQLKGALEAGTSTESSKIILKSNETGSNTISFTFAQWMALPKSEVEGADLVFVRTNLTSFKKDVTKFILTKKQIEAVSGSPVRLDTSRMGASGDEPMIAQTFSSGVKYYRSGKLCVGEGANPTTHTSWFSYEGSTIPGDCGAALCLQEASENRVWMGYHVGYRAAYRECFAGVVSHEVTMEHLDKLEVLTGDPLRKELTFKETVEQAGLLVPAGFEIVEEKLLPLGEYTNRKFVVDNGKSVSKFELEYREMGALTPIGALTRTVSAPVRTNLVATPLFFQKTFKSLVPDYNLKPMRLSPYRTENDEFVFPMEEALRPFSTPVKAIDEVAFKAAVFLAMRPFSLATIKYNGDIWTPEEAVMGRSGASSIPRKTSVGLPMCIDHRDKTFILGNEDQYNVTSQAFLDFKREVISLEQLIRQGKRPFFMARGFLKDETRKEGKSARYIAGTSIHYYVLCRMYFGEIVAASMATFRNHGMVPGINPYQDWEWLYNWVTAKGPKVWDGDFAGFDSSQQPQMLWALLEFINSWYTSRGGLAADNAVRAILFLDLVKSRHVVGRGSTSTTVVQWQKSLPSGHFLTGFVNSMLSMSCLTSAYMATTGCHDFWDHCTAATQGDDNLCGADDSVIDRFNQITVAKHVFDKFGMVYTAGRKGEELKPFLSIDDVTFLQRRFVVKNGRVVGPIRLESCLCNMYYTQKGDAEYRKQTLRQMVENNLSELSLHDEATFQKAVSLIMPVCVDIGYMPRFDVATSKDYFAFTCLREDPGF